MMGKPLIVVTMGDPTGIGPEIIARALARPEIGTGCRVLVLGDKTAMERGIAVTGERLRLKIISEGLPPEELLIQTHDKARVLLALQSLDKRSREILALKFSGELSNREIAKLTGLTESNVGVILYRSLLKLRTLLTSSQMEARHDRA